MKRIIIILMLALILTACQNSIETPQNTDKTTDTTVTDETDYIEGIFFSVDGLFPMILINGTNPCYMKAADASVRFDDLTVGDRIRINNGVMLYTYPGQIRVTRIEKFADGEYSDISEKVISELEKLTELTVDTSEFSKNQQLTPRQP